MIGGNTSAILQQSDDNKVNHLGEKIHQWFELLALTGWLDLSSGDSKYTYNAKLQESTHIFITDYTIIDQDASNKRMVINGKVYDVLLIDDPMGLHQQLEIYLKYVG